MVEVDRKKSFIDEYLTFTCDLSDKVNELIENDISNNGSNYTALDLTNENFYSNIFNYIEDKEYYLELKDRFSTFGLTEQRDIICTLINDDPYSFIIGWHKEKLDLKAYDFLFGELELLLRNLLKLISSNNYDNDRQIQVTQLDREINYFRELLSDINDETCNKILSRELFSLILFLAILDVRLDILYEFDFSNPFILLRKRVYRDILGYIYEILQYLLGKVFSTDDFEIRASYFNSILDCIENDSKLEKIAGDAEIAISPIFIEANMSSNSGVLTDSNINSFDEFIERISDEYISDIDLVFLLNLSEIVHNCTMNKKNIDSPFVIKEGIYNTKLDEMINKKLYIYISTGSRSKKKIISTEIQGILSFMKRYDYKSCDKITERIKKIL